jgi:hypothetical protein
MSKKKFSDAIGIRTCDLPDCSTVPQPTAPPAACPHLKGNIQYNNFIPITHIKHKDKVSSVQTMKACRGSRDKASFILNVNTKWRKPLHSRLGVSQSRSGPSAGKKNLSTLPGIEAHTIQPVQVTVSTMLPWITKFMNFGESLQSQCNM